jgi:hypothetical protein
MVAVSVGIDVSVGVGVGVGVAVTVGVTVAVGVSVAVGVAVGVEVVVAERVGVGVIVGVSVIVAVAVPVGVRVRVGPGPVVGNGVLVRVGQMMMMGVGEKYGRGVQVGVSTPVGACDAVGSGVFAECVAVGVNVTRGRNVMMTGGRSGSSGPEGVRKVSHQGRGVPISGLTGASGARVGPFENDSSGSIEERMLAPKSSHRSARRIAHCPATHNASKPINKISRKSRQPRCSRD